MLSGWGGTKKAKSGNSSEHIHTRIYMLLKSTLERMVRPRGVLTSIIQDRSHCKVSPDLILLGGARGGCWH